MIMSTKYSTVAQVKNQKLTVAKDIAWPRIGRGMTSLAYGQDRLDRPKVILPINKTMKSRVASPLDMVTEIDMPSIDTALPIHEMINSGRNPSHHSIVSRQRKHGDTKAACTHRFAVLR